MLDVLPLGQSISIHCVADPPSDYVPGWHCAHPWAAVYAPVMVAISPGGHVIGLHTGTDPPVD